MDEGQAIVVEAAGAQLNRKSYQTGLNCGLPLYKG